MDRSSDYERPETSPRSLQARSLVTWLLVFLGLWLVFWLSFWIAKKMDSYGCGQDMVGYNVKRSSITIGLGYSDYKISFQKEPAGIQDTAFLYATGIYLMGIGGLFFVFLTLFALFVLFDKGAVKYKGKTAAILSAFFLFFLGIAAGGYFSYRSGKKDGEYVFEYAVRGGWSTDITFPQPGLTAKSFRSNFVSDQYIQEYDVKIPNHDSFKVATEWNLFKGYKFTFDRIEYRVKTASSLSDFFSSTFRVVTKDSDETIGEIKPVHDLTSTVEYTVCCLEDTDADLKQILFLVAILLDIARQQST